MIMGGKGKKMAFSLKDPFVCPKKGIIDIYIFIYIYIYPRSYSGDGIWTINPTLGRSLDFLFGIFDMQWYSCYNIQNVCNYICTRWWFQTLFIFIPYFGEMIQFDEHIFQMGWFNHQLVYKEKILELEMYFNWNCQVYKSIFFQT